MHLSIDSLKEAGAFTGAPIEKEITWKQGDKELTATVVSVRRTHLARLRQAPTDAAAVGRPHSPVASAGVSARP